LKSEGRSGGPIDPLTSFKEVFNELYGGLDDRKYREPHDHPLFEYLAKFKFSETPGMGMEEYDEGGADS